MQPLSVPDDDRRGRLIQLLGVALVCAVGFGGCASPPKPLPPKVLKANIEASASANPDSSRRPSPVVLRIYELKASAAFDSGDFLTMYEKDQQALGAEMAGREEFLLRPGDKRVWEKTTTNDIRFLGVVAAFRDLEHARWKTMIPIKANATNVISITVDGVTVSGSVVTQ